MPLLYEQQHFKIIEVVYSHSLSAFAVYQSGCQHTRRRFEAAPRVRCQDGWLDGPATLGHATEARPEEVGTGRSGGRLPQRQAGQKLAGVGLQLGS